MSEAIEAELVLVALGARARIELAESAGIEAENGAIVVDGCGGGYQQSAYLGCR